MIGSKPPMAKNYNRHISRIGLIGPISLIFVLALSFAPSPVWAGCCVCGYDEGASIDEENDVEACYHTMSKETCGDTSSNYGSWIRNFSLWVFIGGTVPLKVCTWESQSCKTTGKWGKYCPDVTNTSGGSNDPNFNIVAVTRAPIQFTPQVTIPGTKFIAGKPIDIESATIARYIAGLYYFIISSIGILAVVGIMIGGFQYLMAAGSPEKITQAKTSITSAIIGLIIALTSYLLFSTINPNLVDFTKGIRATEVASEEASFMFSCAAERESSLLVLSQAGGVFKPPADRVIVDNTQVEHPGRLQMDVIARLRDTKLKDWLTKNKYSIVITSAFRTTGNQQELYDCYMKSVKIGGVAYCPYNCTTCNEAARPNCNAPHTTGYAVDVRLKSENVANLCPGNPIMSGVCREFQQKMKDVGFGRFCLEGWHYESPLLPQKSKWCDPLIYNTAQASGGGTGEDSGDSE